MLVVMNGWDFTWFNPSRKNTVLFLKTIKLNQWPILIYSSGAAEFTVKL